MACWLAVDKDGTECIFNKKPIRVDFCSRWEVDFDGSKDYDDSHCMELPKGSIKKLIGRELAWEDEPVELTEDSV